MPSDTLTVDLTAWGLDDLALAIRQDHWKGNRGQWFGSFRGGFYGMVFRVGGAQLHYRALYAWRPVPREVTDAEYHAATMLFHMDSAIECMTFALKALGYGASIGGFRDVTDRRELQRISPTDILGTSRRATQPGYAVCFPRLQAFLQGHSVTLQAIMDQHDVSKHRELVCRGGGFRTDAPAGFYETLGIPPGDAQRTEYAPWSTILLDPDPKSPRVGRTSVADRSVRLEHLAEQFASIVSQAGWEALADVQTTIGRAP